MFQKENVRQLKFNKPGWLKQSVEKKLTFNLFEDVTTEIEDE